MAIAEARALEGASNTGCHDDVLGTASKVGCHCGAGDSSNTNGFDSFLGCAAAGFEFSRWCVAMEFNPSSCWLDLMGTGAKVMGKIG